MRTDEYEIRVTFLDGGEHMVQVAGRPYPLGMYKETGFDLVRLLAEAHACVIEHRNAPPDVYGFDAAPAAYTVAEPAPHTSRLVVDPAALYLVRFGNELEGLEP